MNNSNKKKSYPVLGDASFFLSFQQTMADFQQSHFVNVHNSNLLDLLRIENTYIYWQFIIRSYD